jgi:hypothetical protein
LHQGFRNGCGKSTEQGNENAHLRLDYRVIAVVEQFGAPLVGDGACGEGTDADVDVVVGWITAGDYGIIAFAEGVDEDVGVLLVGDGGDLDHKLLRGQ